MKTSIYRDWSGLSDSEDLILIVMRALAIPDLLRAGAVCTTWRATCADVHRVRFPITDSSPCLLYSCATDDADTATVYSVSTGAVFKVRLPPSSVPFRSGHVVGSGHGWIVTADDVPRFRALNPLTGAQVDLPPATGLERQSFTLDRWQRCSPSMLRVSTYLAYLSCNPAVGSACAVLLVHQAFGDLYFAHVGDDRWIRIRINRRGTSLPIDRIFHGAVYNKNDGLFYVLSDTGCVYTLDLNGPSPPEVRSIFTEGVEEAVARCWPGSRWGNIIVAPWGDILQVWRIKKRKLTGPAYHSYSFTNSMLLVKVDVDDHKLVKMSAGDLRGHALFLGFNASLCIPTKDIPRLKPNCAYLTNGSWKQLSIMRFSSREVGIWNFETNRLQRLGKVQSDHPWLNWSAPIWITPSLS